MKSGKFYRSENRLVLKFNTREILPFVYIFGAALIMGAIAQFAIGPTSFENLSGEQSDYHRLAVKIRSEGSFGEPERLAYRAPLYPFVLGIVYSKLGTSIILARTVNWLLAGMMATVAAMLAHNLSHSLKAAWLAAAIVCTNSYWWLLQSELMPENLAAVLLGLAAWCWPNFGDRSRGVGHRLRKHGIWAAASGLCLGLSLLCKPTFLLALVLLPVLAVFLSSSLQRQSQVVFALIVLVVAALPLGAWTYRNCRVLDAWVPLTTDSGEVFWGAHAPETIATAKGSWTNQALPAEFQARIEAEDPNQRELASSKVCWEAGWASLRAASFVELALHFLMKPLRLWSPSVYFEATGFWWGLKLPLILLNTVVLGAFFYQLRRHYIVRPLVVAIGIGLTVSALIFWGTIRSQYLMLPIIAAISAQACYQYLPDSTLFKISRRKQKRQEKFRETEFD